jgi:MFS family permease
MFSSLKVKNFRLYWLGMFISLIGTWVQVVAQSWLMFQLTNSVFLLGLVGFLSSIPIFLLSLFAGVLADRMNKKNILLFTQNAFMLLAFLLALLTQMKLITPAQIMLLALLNGIVMAFDAPARQAVIADLVGKEHLLNAIALNSAAFNSARIIGPALAGILIAGIGMSGCFYINGVSFLAVIIALLLININNGPKRNTGNFLLKDLSDGLRFIKDNRIILILISMVGITSLFGISYVILMPVFANDVLNVGVKGLGSLMSSAGFGALIAALVLARLGDFKYKGKLLISSSIIFSISLVLFSLSKTYFISLITLILIGAASVTATGLINTLLQTLVPDEFRGRAMSAFMLTFAGFMPFGNLLAGTLSHIWGVSITVLIGGITCAVFFIIINILYPQIRNI